VVAQRVAVRCIAWLGVLRGNWSTMQICPEREQKESGTNDEQTSTATEAKRKPTEWQHSE
jgi:hypothetical protein